MLPNACVFFALTGYLILQSGAISTPENGSQLNDTSVLTGLPFRHTMYKRALQKIHEKTQSEKWQDKFLGLGNDFDQSGSLVNLINKLALEYLADCTPIILYDTFTEASGDLLLQQLFQKFPIAYVHGQITENYRIKVTKMVKNSDTCSSYVLFMKDVMRCLDVIGSQSHSKVVVVARSSQWRVYEFLSNDVSQAFMNLLVIAKSEKIQSSREELPYILYTHRLFVDALGSSIHEVLTSWYNGKLTRPHISLFPKKITRGFSGHRFLISLAHQPPFVIKRARDDNDDIMWDGIEVRLIDLLSKMFNFTTDYREAKDYFAMGAPEAVTKVIENKKANLGIAGLYTTEQRLIVSEVSVLHSQDCATFISLTSTALPRYRAIFGPFHWTVWVSITLMYLLAIFPIAYSDKHTLKHLIKKPEEIENMFWYVFGTFTNCFTFTGKGSWSHSDKVATRLFIGFYWIFTIIITACYTGSIIAFVTLPVYPATIDTPEQLLAGKYQIGTLDKGGWQYWFDNTTDPVAEKLLKNIEYLPDIESGLRNTTQAFLWGYAFLGSRDQLDYIVRTNFTTTKKRSLLHIGSHCFVPFSVGIIYNKNSIYNKIIDIGILKAVQSGFLTKLKQDVEWLMMRSATGKMLAANSFGNAIATLSVEDRALTLDDTQGMFLLLGIGFIAGGSSLMSEWMGGCIRFCKGRGNRATSATSIESRRRSFNVPTPRQKLDSIQYNNAIITETGHLAADLTIDHFKQNATKQNSHPNSIIHTTSIDDDGQKFGDVFGDKTDPALTNAKPEELKKK